jgi:hypothetical protein
MSSNRARAVGKAPSAKRPSLAMDVIASNLETMTLGTFAEADRDTETQGQAKTGQKWPFYDPVPQTVRTAERDVQQWCAVPDTELHAAQVRGVLKQLNASKRYLRLEANESVDTAKKSTMCNALLRYYRNLSKRKELRAKARAALEAYRAIVSRIVGDASGANAADLDPRDILLQERETLAEQAALVETPADMTVLLHRWETNTQTLQQLEDGRRALYSLRRALAPLYLPLPLHEGGGQPRGWVPPRQSRVGTLSTVAAGGSASTTSTSQPQGTTVQVNFLNENLKNVTPARVQEMVAALLAQARNPNAVAGAPPTEAAAAVAAAPVYFTGEGNPLGSSKRAKRPVGRTDNAIASGVSTSGQGAISMDVE